MATETDPNAPILFYAGNEGDVMGFYNNVGLMTDKLGPQYKSLVVFAEHRYYGTSMPFGSSAEAFKNENLKYLTAAQAMMDFVLLVKQIKIDYNLPNSPVIVFGGSYGGMLAAWLRQKFPHVFQAALASSAPILFFEGAVSPYAYTQVATKSFGLTDPKCIDVIK